MKDLAKLRLEYMNAIMEPTSANLTDEDERAVIAELRRFMLDMLDCCEQTLIAEPAIGAALKALEVSDPSGRLPG